MRHSAPGFRAIQGYVDAVREIGDGDANAAADVETATAVKHLNSVGDLERLQTELPKTVLALLPQKTSDTLKKKQQKLKEKNQDQDLKQDKKMEQENEMKDWNQDNKGNMNQIQNGKQNQDRAQETVDITGGRY